MSQPKSDHAKLVCKECGYENEAERVYCHNCGVKLDRALLPSASDKVQPSERRRKETIRQVRKATHGATGGVMHTFFGPLFRSVALAFLAGCIVQSVRPPDEIPDPNDLSVDSPFIQFDLEDALKAPGPRRAVYSEAQLNAYLKTTVRAKGRNRGSGGQIEFKRAFTHLYKEDGGSIDFIVEHEIFGKPFYISQRYGPVGKDGKITAELRGGSMGRLTFPPFIARAHDIVFKKFWKALDKELVLLGKMQSITVGDRSVEVISKPAAKAP